MKFTIAVIPGDGIGPEVTNQAKKALDAIADVYNHVFLYKEAEMGACAMEKTGNPLPQKTIEICKKADAILFGAIGAPKYDNDPTAKVRPEQGLLQLRKELDLYCNVSPVKAYDRLIKNSPLKQDIILGTDLVIYRELTGGIYFGEKELSKDEQSAFDICSYTVKEISRITHLAFKAAQGRRKKVTLIDKADVLETSRLWRKTVSKIAEEYKDVTLNFLFADNASIAYSASILNEHAANTGSIDNSLTLTLSSDSYTGLNGENYLATGKATVTNLPLGFSAVLSKTSASVLTFTISGNATAHANSDDIANLDLELSATAFDFNMVFGFSSSAFFTFSVKF